MAVIVTTVSVVQSPRALGALVLVVALACGGGATGLVRQAAAIPEPDMPTGRRVEGRAVSVSSSPCQTRPRGLTCYRPVVRYAVDGVPAELVSRDAYTPNPYPAGTAVDVALLPDGAAWLAPEWDGRIAAARDAVRQRRRQYHVFAGLLGGVGALFGLLAIGMVAFVDRSGAPAPGSPTA